MKKYLITFLALAIGFSACQNGCNSGSTDPDPVTPEDTTPAVVDTTRDDAPMPQNPNHLPEGQFEQLQYSKGLDDCPVGAEDCAYFLMEFPWMKLEGANNKALNQNIKEWMLAPIDELGTAGKDYDEQMNLFLERYEQVAATETVLRPWFMERRAVAKYNLDDFVTFELSLNTYSGGAQAVTFVVMTTYRKKNGKRLDLTEVLVEGQDDALRAALNKRLREVLSLDSKTSLKEKGFYVDNIDMTQNFALQDGAITFYYNSGDIAEYAYGSTQLTFGMQELEGIIKPVDEL